MSKELKALKIGIPKLKKLYENSAKKMSQNDILGFDLVFVYLDKALKRLEAIDNANPSEALECLEEMYELSCDGRIPEHSLYEYIKQALLKAQEPKKYLKWEDLEFGKTTHKLKAKMNDSLYCIEWYVDGMGSKVVCLNKYITNDYLIHSACIKEYNQQFFNDLRLERVEE